jgi:hypothetical protein
MERDLFQAFFSEIFNERESFSTEFMFDLTRVKSFYEKWKIIDEVVKEHPDVFENIPKLSSAEQSVRFQYFDNKRDEMKVKFLHEQMVLMKRYLGLINDWLKSHPNNIFDSNLEAGMKLDFVRRVCQIYDKDKKIVPKNVNTAIEYTNFIIKETGISLKNI